MPDCTTWLIRTKPMLEAGAAIATTITAIVAVLALRYARAQISTASRNQQEATAKALYGDYLRMAFQDPLLATADAAELAKPGERARYEWFLSRALWSWEEILALTGEDKTWRGTLRAQIQRHLAFFGSSRFRSEFYSTELNALIKETLLSGASSDGRPA